MKLNLVAALLDKLIVADNLQDITEQEVDGAHAELTAYHASLAPEVAPPALKVWTVVKVIGGDHQGDVGTVQGGNGSALMVVLDGGDGKPVQIDAANLEKLA